MLALGKLGEQSRHASYSQAPTGRQGAHTQKQVTWMCRAGGVTSNLVLEGFLEEVLLPVKDLKGE